MVYVKRLVKEKIDYALSLFGVKTHERIINDLTEKGFHYYESESKRMLILLMGFANTDTQGEIRVHYCRRARQGIARFVLISIKHAMKFILGRIEEFSRLKGKSLNRYPSTLFNALILLQKLNLR